QLLFPSGDFPIKAVRLDGSRRSGTRYGDAMGRYGRGAAFTVDTRPGRRGTTIIEASGELDFHTGPMLRDSVLHSVTAGNPEIVLDLGGLEFLDSTGLAVLIRGLK